MRISVTRKCRFIYFLSFQTSNRIEVQVAGTNLGLENGNEMEYDEVKEARKVYSYWASAEAAATLINDFHRRKDSLHLADDNSF